MTKQKRGKGVESVAKEWLSRFSVEGKLNEEGRDDISRMRGNTTLTDQ